MIYVKEERTAFITGDALLVEEFAKLYGSPLRTKARKQKMPALMTGWLQNQRIQGKMTVHSMN